MDDYGGQRRDTIAHELALERFGGKMPAGGLTHQDQARRKPSAPVLRVPGVSARTDGTMRFHQTTKNTIMRWKGA